MEPQRKKRVLICEADLQVLKACETVLRKKGYQTKRCDRTDSIFEVIDQSNPSCILMDTHFQNKRAEDIVLSLKKSAYKSIPVILFSTYNNIEDIAKRCKADGFIEKPFDIQSLEETIKKFTEPSEDVV